ncbi:MAG TPA: hypothetical protein VI727_04300 [Candidatus Brocadiaceae bacterium]|nr:hypothetical protein [Candidatus Brocadiaceae bacterium]
MFYPGFEYLKYYTPDTSELTIISINLHKTVDSALQSAYKLEVAFHHSMAKLQPKIGHRLRRLKRKGTKDTKRKNLGGWADEWLRFPPHLPNFSSSQPLRSLRLCGELNYNGIFE